MMNRTRYPFLRLRLTSKGLLLIGMILCGAFTSPVWGAEELEALPWSQLALKEQSILTPFKDQWGGFSSSRQHRLQHGAQRYQQMSPVEQQAMRKRFNRWKALPPEKREYIKQRFKAFRQLPPNKRKMLREKRRWFQDLPQERRRQLKNRWKNLPPQRREQIRKRMGKSRTRSHRPHR